MAVLILLDESSNHPPATQLITLSYPMGYLLAWRVCHDSLGNSLQCALAPGQSRLKFFVFRDKADHQDGVPCVIPAKAGNQSRKLPCDVSPCDERRAWIPACAGMTKVSKRASFVTISPRLHRGQHERERTPALRRDCPDRPMVYRCPQPVYVMVRLPPYCE